MGPSAVVGLGRFELPTPRLSSVCSNQLSYRPSRALRWGILNRTPPVKEPMFRFSQN